MYCGKCGAELAEEDAFCRRCGNPVPLAQPSPEAASAEESQPPSSFSTEEGESSEEHFHSATAPADNRWFEKQWVAIVALTLFFPLGLYLTWRYQQWRIWVKLAASVLSLVVAFFVIFGGPAQYWENGDSQTDADFSLAFTRVQSTVSEAGFGLAEAHLAVSSCVTDEECIAAGDSLSQENTTYIPVLETQITELENMEVPEDWLGIHAAYLEQLRLRVESGEQFIEGWETFDDALIERSFETFRESQAKLADILDELEALNEGR